MTHTLEKAFENISWKIIKSYYKDKQRFVQHHINSYNNFIDIQIPEIIRNNSPLIIPSDYNKDKNQFETKYYLNFGKIYMSKPIISGNDGKVKSLYPSIARLRKMTYSSTIYCDVDHKIVKYIGNKEEVKELPKLNKIIIGKIPIMLRSKYCILNNKTNKTAVELGESEYDFGGYFIVSGSEKVVVCQERKCENKTYVFDKKKIPSTFSHVAEISSVSKKDSFIRRKCQIKLTAKKGKVFKVVIQGLKQNQEIPLFVLFRALGVISDKKILEYIVYNIDDPKNNILIEFLRTSLDEASPIQDQEIALEYISKFTKVSHQDESDNFKLKRTLEIIKNNLLPHVGDSIKKKAYYLGYMVNKLLKCYFGWINYDDRDSFINKRVTTTGDLLATLFRTNFKRMIDKLKRSIYKDLNQSKIEDIYFNISKKIKSSDIEQRIKYALATGNWGDRNQASSVSKKGIAQVLSRISYLQTLSHLRRVNNPISRNGKEVGPRKLHNTQWGILCPSETPDGAPVGVVKHMALMSYITIGSNAETVLSCVDELGIVNLDDVEPYQIYNNVKVFLNGDFIGISKDPHNFVTQFRKLRRGGVINIFVSIAWYIQKNEININTDGGRMCRPIFIVRNNKLNVLDKYDTDNIIQWDNLLYDVKYQDMKCECKNILNKESDAILEYIDTEESDTAMIAMSYANLKKNDKKNESFFNYTHCEIQPAVIQGAVVATIPFSGCTQAPRNAFYPAQGKQAIGVYTTNYLDRMDTLSYVLHYPQVPLVNTKLGKIIGTSDMPTGINAIVAIAAYTGYNQEDSLIFNKSALDRGLFTSNYYKTYTDSEKKNQSSLDEEKFCKPIKINPNGTLRTAGMKGSYDKLDDKGFIKVGSKIEKDDVLIGKIIPQKINSNNDVKFRDNSTRIRENVDGYVDKVYESTDGEGYKFCKVKVRKECEMVMGDKMSSRCAQKGTIGMIYPQEDMPFTKDGIVPDIIMNPLALPSRMTIGQLIECLLGKVSILRGHESDATPFNKIDIDDIADILQNLGFDRYGTEIMYNGKTGEQIKANIFIGPTYYHKLKHMVKGKIHSRNTGPYQAMTRQPTEGRARDGGGRIGHMEKNVMLAHGAVQFLKERFFNMSDKYLVYICKKCGMMAVANPIKNIYKCTYCKNMTDFVQVQIPYASKLFLHELQSMGIATHLETSS